MGITLRGIYKSPHFAPIMIVAAISVVMIILPLKTRTTLSRLAAESLFLPFIETDRYLTKINATFERNITLNRKLDSLAIEVATLHEHKRENVRLRRMLDFDFVLPYSLIPAEILAISPTSTFKSVLIDAGRSRGVAKNMPVISPSGIIGKTIATDNKASTVQLLLDPSCKVAARIQRSRAMGIVEYTGGEYLTLSRVPADQDVVEGDAVISSGLGGIFPQGLFVGTVIKSEVQEGDLFKNIIIKPGADFSIIEEVFVIVSQTGD
ncbi:MAG: rod shape-determining protein MreC [candidate division Zixibacteria bacterium]